MCYGKRIIYIPSIFYAVSQYEIWRLDGSMAMAMATAGISFDFWFMIVIRRMEDTGRDEVQA